MAVAKSKIKKVKKINFLDVGCGAGPFTIGLNKKILNV